jgi:hypothetical protein
MDSLDRTRHNNDRHTNPSTITGAGAVVAASLSSARRRLELLLAAPVLHLRPPVAEQAGLERQEPRRVPRDGDEEHAAVERHEREHEQVRPADAQRVHRRARRPCRRRAPPAPGGSTGEERVQPAGAQELEDEREREDGHERQRVHAAVGAGPPREEDL